MFKGLTKLKLECGIWTDIESDKITDKIWH